MGNTRGAAVQAAKKFLIGRYGPEAFADLLTGVDPEKRRLFENSLPISWVDAQVISEVYRHACHKLGGGGEQFYYEIGRFNAENDVKAYYKFLLSVASPAFIFNRLPNIWESYFDTGELRVEVTGRMATGFLTGFADAGILCLTTSGFVEKALEMTGAGNPQVRHTGCISRGDNECRFEAVWD